MACQCGTVDRRKAIAIRLVDIRFCRDQQFDDLRMTFVGGTVDWCPAILVRCFNVRLCLNQQLDDFRMPCRGGTIKGCALFFAVFCIDIRALRDQRFDRIRFAFGGRADEVFPVCGISGAAQKRGQKAADNECACPGTIRPSKHSFHGTLSFFAVFFYCRNGPMPSAARFRSNRFYPSFICRP